MDDMLNIKSTIDGRLDPKPMHVPAVCQPSICMDAANEKFLQKKKKQQWKTGAVAAVAKDVDKTARSTWRLDRLTVVAALLLFVHSLVPFPASTFGSITWRRAQGAEMPDVSWE
jgi:hypothetical protein